MKKGKNIFCLEGIWENKIDDKSTILPILDLLNKKGYCDYVYNKCATKAELEFYLEKWIKLSVKKKYPILYLAFHGQKECICLSPEITYTIKDLEKLLDNQCYRKIIHFGSCSTLQMNDAKIDTFLTNTKALAVFGYRKDIDWMKSTALDLFIFEALQYEPFDHKGIKKIEKMITSNYGSLHDELKLIIKTNPIRVVRPNA